MPTVTIHGPGDEPRKIEVDAGTRLVLAIEQAGIDIGHRCGGFALCTTCRVQFLDGEPDKITEAEAAKLEEKGLSGQARLSCQIQVEADMTVRPLMLASEQGWPDPGPRPEEEITPEPTWVALDEVER